MQGKLNKQGTSGFSLVGSIIMIIKGGLIGIANVIPGVSGGTLALVLGIFDRLIGALKSISSKTVTSSIGFVFGFWKQNNRKTFVEEMKKIDIVFLGLILIGAGLTIAVTAKLISFLVEYHTAPTLAFFVGLIIPSIAIPLKMMEKKGLIQILWVIIGIVMTVGISLLLQYTSMATALGQSNNAILMSGVLLFCGFIAISAMILPGLSGSYILMLAGQYFFIMSIVAKITDYLTTFGKSDIGDSEIGLAIFYMVVFAIGCVLGLLLFARLLNFFLKKFHASTMGFLVGLVLGSLFVLWPFKGLPPNPELAKMATNTTTFQTELNKKLNDGIITEVQFKKAIKQRKSTGNYLPRNKWLPAAKNVIPNSEAYLSVGGKTDDLYWSLGSLLIGLILSFGIIRLGKE